jgi:dipeptidyl aminopeptidase/acylaminoacyl peptidase
MAQWSPDRSQIAFSSDQDDRPKLRVKNASGGGEEILVDRRAFPLDWSRDGRKILFLVHGGATGQDIWMYDFDTKKAAPYLDTPFAETAAKFSPDGRWVAYVSNESRTPQVYVRPVADASGRTQASTNGGVQPLWNPKGGELFYLAPDTTLMAVKVTGTASPSVSAPDPLFTMNVEPDRVVGHSYAVAPDGQRFLVMVPLVDPKASAILGVLNWKAALR